MAEGIRLTKKEFIRRWNSLLFGIANGLTTVLVRTAPVRTGHLRNSIGFRIKGNIIELHMVDYTLHVEFGTAFQRPQPFIRAAFRNDLPQIVKDNMKRGFA